MIYINLLIVFLIIVAIHEFGHYLAARIFGAKVTDFSIGFGKPIFQFTDKRGTNWKISPIPLGGYVKIKGLDSIFQKKQNSEVGSFQSLKLHQQIIILLAGSFFNIFSAWFVLFSFYFFIGIKSFSPEIGDVLKNSPADKVDIQKGDIIISINDIQISKFSDIPIVIGNNTFVSMELIRNNSIINKNLELQFDNKLNRKIIGITSTSNLIIERFDIIKSIKQSFIFIPNYYYQSFSFLIKSFKDNTITSQLAGPIGIVKMADQMMLDKLTGVLLLFIVISLFVGLFNLFPIPLLDGGHIVYFIIRKFFSNSLPEFVTRIYLVVGITIISFLFIIVTLNDIFYK